MVIPRRALKCRFENYVVRTHLQCSNSYFDSLPSTQRIERHFKTTSIPYCTSIEIVLSDRFKFLLYAAFLSSRAWCYNYEPVGQSQTRSNLVYGNTAYHLLIESHSVAISFGGVLQLLKLYIHDWKPKTGCKKSME